jgi:dolichyl-phosphate beta-glucosyltransferase
MTPRLRVLAVAGAGLTVIDVGLFTVLVGVGWWLVAADVAALTVAAGASWVVHRQLPFSGHGDRSWVGPGRFVVVGVVAGAVDLLALTAFVALGIAPVTAKLGAVAVAAVVRWTGYRSTLSPRMRRELAVRTERGPAPGDRRLTVVIPAYREAERIGDTLDALRRTIEPQVPAEELELLVVDDGSPDATAEEARRRGADRVIGLEANRGKGAAVRAGMLAARGRSVVFTDADLAYPPETVLLVLHELEAGWDLVVGSRRHVETTTLVRAARLRELGGRVVNWFTHLVLLGQFRDTQCGIKGFRSDVARSVFERTRIDGFAFDVELFLIAERDRLSLLEVPVRVQNRASSSVHLVRDTRRLLADLLRIRRWEGRGFYAPRRAPGAVADQATGGVGGGG